ncbi:MAG: carbamoyltransferase C-terminal domain-containing protein [Hyphomicrobium sp.]
MRILGLVGATHDSGIAILDDGDIDLVIEEERLKREKRTRNFPRHALVAALGSDGRGLTGIDALVTPWDVKRLRASFAKALAGRLPASLCLLSERSHTPQRNEIAILNHFLTRKLKRTFPACKLPPLINVGHHDSHAASFFVSPFDEANVLVMDGYGDDAATSVYSGAGNKLERRWHSSFFNSLGMVYTFVTGYLGFEQLAGEGTVMALAAYGDDSYVARFRDVVRLTGDGRYQINMDYFSFDAFGEIRPLTRKFFDTFGPARGDTEPLEDRHRAIAYALQHVSEDVILHIVREISRTSPSRNLVLAGGVALNCVANARILADTPVERLWVPPGSSDTGAPLGACLWHHHQTMGGPRRFELKRADYGLSYSEEEIVRALRAAGLKSEVLPDADLFSRVAGDLAEGRVAGWFQGRFEMGPRALGHRSILADPRRADMRDILNAKIKKREYFRPFAPAVLAERAAEYFVISQPDPFMTLAPVVRPEKRGDIVAAVHKDGTGRLQTVDRDDHPRFHALISAFASLTGVPVLLNTSFNRQEPIVASPDDAVSCFLRTEMDVLVLANHYVTRQPR